MTIDINKRIVSEILNDESFYDELTQYLNTVIEKEIAKGDEMDDELVSECVDMLTELKSSELDEVAEKYYNSEKLINFCKKKNYARKAASRRVAASVALILVASVVTLQTQPALAKQIKGFFEQIVQALSAADEETYNAETNVKALYAAFDDNQKTTIKDESEIDLKNIRIYAITANGEEKEIPLSECKTEKHYINSDGENKIIVIISYGGCSFSINYTLEG